MPDRAPPAPRRPRPETPRLPGAPPAGIAVETLTVIPVDYPVMLRSYGTVRPRTENTLYAQVAGQVARQRAPAGPGMQAVRRRGGLRGGDARVRSFRQQQVKAAIRFCEVLFGHDYASLMNRAAENAVNSAEDAFGTSIGSETVGLYSASSARGFNPQLAGNIRLDGLYFDQVLRIVAEQLGANAMHGCILAGGAAKAELRYDLTIGDFEKALQKYLGADDRHVVALSTGHAALHL